VVTITSRILPAPEGGVQETCQIIVTDNGIGFDSKYAGRIFAPFQRLHGRHEFEGTGMGLAICRKIAERHNGSITAISAPGEGSSFVVTLPVKQTDVGGTLWTQEGSPSASSWPMTTPMTAS
jgi:signal transduction histidine kinase